MIGSPCAYLSHNRRTITWLSNYMCLIWTFCNWIPVVGYPSDLHVNYAHFNGSTWSNYYYIIMNLNPVMLILLGWRDFLMLFLIFFFFQFRTFFNSIVFYYQIIWYLWVTVLARICQLPFGFYFALDMHDCCLGLGGGNDPKFEQLNNRFIITTEIDPWAENYH